MISIGIVGCGIGGNAVLRSIHNLTDVNVIGVSDLNESAPGVVYALSIQKRATTRIFRNCCRKDPDMIIEVTGNSKVREQIRSG